MPRTDSTGAFRLVSAITPSGQGSQTMRSPVPSPNRSPCSRGFRKKSCLPTDVVAGYRPRKKPEGEGGRSI
jgi:hypothetical protein